MPVDFRPVLACVQASIKAEVIGQPALMYNVLHFQTQDAEPDQGTVDLVMNLVKNWVNGTYNQNFSSDVRVTEIRAQSLFASAAPFNFVGVSYQGTQTNLDEIAHAPLMLLHGSLSDRHQAGRLFAFPLGGPQLQTGYPDAYYVNMTNALNQLIVSSAFAGVALAVASRDTGVCYRVRSVGHSNRLTMQKRRRLGFGR